MKRKERNLFYRASNNSTYYARNFLEHLEATTNLALTQIEPRAWVPEYNVLSNEL